MSTTNIRRHIAIALADVVRWSSDDNASVLIRYRLRDIAFLENLLRSNSHA